MLSIVSREDRRSFLTQQLVDTISNTTYLPLSVNVSPEDQEISPAAEISRHVKLTFASVGEYKSGILFQDLHFTESCIHVPDLLHQSVEDGLRFWIIFNTWRGDVRWV